MNEFRPIDSIKKAALVATWAYFAGAALGAGLLIYEIWILRQFDQGLWTYDALVTALERLNGITFALLLPILFAVIVNSMWVFRANRNARTLLPNQQIQSPWLTTLGHMIPIANLWLPFKGFRQVHNIAQNAVEPLDRPAASWLNALWAFWMFGNIADRISARLFLSESESDYDLGLWVGLAASVLFMASAFLFIRYIREVSEGLQAQHGNQLAEEVFGD